MQVRKRIACLVRGPFHWRRSGGESVEAVRAAEEQEAIEFLKSIRQKAPARKPTDEEVTIAAWANLAVEEKDLTLDEARRLLVST